ncbi:MAG: patatin-like phospholipase family protein [Pseudomonadota bacterium]
MNLFERETSKGTNPVLKLVLGLTLVLLQAFVTSGCSTLSSRYFGPAGGPVGPVPLSRYQPSPFVNADSGPILVGLACSGGGSRAAYLTAAVLREIRRSELRIDVGNRSTDNKYLLDQIDFVSAVSGGALSAGYFVANIDQLRADLESEAWEDYLNKMAANYRQRQWYWHGILNPISWFKALFTKFNRGNIARDDYDNMLFEGKTIADLPERPVLYLNAFDVGNRVRFVFSRHFIDTGFYHEKGWTNKLGEPQDLTSENDLVFSRIDPKTVRLADAVYASSAFPFAYPNLALRHFGSKIPYQGSLVFLADGGLADNSGLLTLFTQMSIEFDRLKNSRLVVAIYIDASLDSTRHGTLFQVQGTEADYAWRDTYVGHGRAGVEAGFGHLQDRLSIFLEKTGVLMDDIILNYKTKLLSMPPSPDREERASWFGEYSSGRLLLRPLAIGLRLRDVGEAYYTLWSRYKNEGAKDVRLLRLFEASGIPSGFDQNGWPAKSFQALVLERRVSELKTDFVLGKSGRKVLDLVAYLLVHGKLKPALTKWSRIASTRFKEEQD